MKKIILLTLAIILVTSCGGDVNGTQLNQGDTKTYEIKDYLIIFEISGFNGFGTPIWKFKEIINKKDSL